MTAQRAALPQCSGLPAATFENISLASEISEIFYCKYFPLGTPARLYFSAILFFSSGCWIFNVFWHFRLKLFIFLSYKKQFLGSFVCWWQGDHEMRGCKWRDVFCLALFGSKYAYCIKYAQFAQHIHQEKVFAISYKAAPISTFTFNKILIRAPWVLSLAFTELVENYPLLIYAYIYVYILWIQVNIYWRFLRATDLVGSRRFQQ